jgi:hypothetical protein
VQYKQLKVFGNDRVESGVQRGPKGSSFGRLLAELGPETVANKSGTTNYLERTSGTPRKRIKAHAGEAIDKNLTSGGGNA